MMRISSSGMSRGEEESSSSASVSSGHTVETAHALFLPRLAKLNTVSHPVRAWNIGSAQALSGPDLAAISCAAMYRKLWPVPTAIHSLSSGCNSCARDTASTITSVSTVRMHIAWYTSVRRVHGHSWRILLFDQTIKWRECTYIDLVRKKIFARKNNMQLIPPTKIALEEHLKRAVYQGGHVWGQILLPASELSQPTNQPGLVKDWTRTVQTLLDQAD